MEVSTINSSPTQPQQQQQTAGSKNNTTTTTNQQLMGNDNMQSHTQTRSPIILTELTTIKSNASGSSHNFSNNNNNNNNTNTRLNNTANVNNNNNGTSSIVSRPHKSHDNIQSVAGMTIDDRDNDNANQLRKDVKSLVEALLARIESETSQITVATAKESQPSLLASSGNNTHTETSLITAIVDDEVDDEGKPKDIITLRNLEITPPPQSTSEEQELISETSAEKTPPIKTKRASKRTSSESTEPNDESMSSRGKRQRRQTKLFQVEEITRSSSRSSNAQSEKSTTSNRGRASSSPTKTATTPPKPQPQPKPQVNHDLQDVIFYEKNDYLAIRNEENSFYLCQLAENVRIQRPLIKIKWLDTKDDGKTYFLTSHYDKVPQKSIIMPVILNKLKSEKRGEQLFSLNDALKDNIMERLRRSLNMPSENEQ